MLLSKLPKHFQALEDEIMMLEEKLKSQFGQFPELIQNTEYILNQSSIQFDLRVDKNKKFLTDNATSDWNFLVTETWKGFEKRYPAGDVESRKRVEKELKIIKLKNFCSYYLITYDLICFAKRQGFDYVGRGSGANSVVAYCLEITDVDPIDLDLYFERFLNSERSSPPDFDMDFSWDNRDAVYDYIFSRYDANHVCLLGTHVTYQKNRCCGSWGKSLDCQKRR